MVMVQVNTLLVSLRYMLKNGSESKLCYMDFIPIQKSKHAYPPVAKGKVNFILSKWKQPLFGWVAIFQKSLQVEYP